MESGGLSGVLHCQGKTVLNAVDAFVLRSVVAVETLDILHHADGGNIKDKDPDPDQALRHGQKEMAPYHVFKKGGNEVGKDEEKAYGQGKGKDGHQDRQDAFQLCVLFLVLFRSALILFVFRPELGGIIDASHAQDQGVYKDKNASDKGRLFKEGILQDPVVFHGLRNDGSVGLSDGRGVAGPVAHHDAFKDSLAADAGIVLGAFGFAFRHSTDFLSVSGPDAKKAQVRSLK